MKNIPKKIYLQVGDECDGEDFKELSEVSWCKDKIYENDIEFVRIPENGFLIQKGSEVNSILTAIMRSLNLEQKIVLRDKLIRRTPERKGNVGVSDAIEFAEWIINERYIFDFKKKKYVAAWNNYQELTIQELYKIFQESQPQQKEVDEGKLLNKLKSECKRIKMQRNNYEQELIQVRRKISKLQSELEIFKFTHK